MEEDMAPNNNKESQKGKDKPNQRDIQAKRHTVTDLEAANSDGKRKAMNA